MARPPLKAAREQALRQLVRNHQDEYTDLVDEALAAKGWAQQVVERKVWKQVSTSNGSGNTVE